MDAAKPVLAGATEGTELQQVAAAAMKNHGMEDGLSGTQRLWAHIPWSKTNASVSAISRLNGDLEKGLAGLKPGENGGLEALLAGKEGATPGTKDLAELVLNKWKAGEIEVHSRTGFGMLPFGLSSKVRGAIPMVGDRSKPMFEWSFKNGKAVLELDGRLTGKTLAAHFAAAGTKLLPNEALQAMGIPASELVGATAKGSKLAALQTSVLGLAGKEMVDSHVLDLTTNMSGPGKLWGMWRPGASDDVVKAMTNLGKDTSGKTGLMAKFAGLPKGAQFGIGAAALAGVGYLGYKQFFAPKDPAPTADQQAGQAQGGGKDAQQGQAPAGPSDAQAGGQQAQGSELSQDDVAVLQQFAQMPLDQQQQVLSDGVDKLKAAVAQAGGAKMSDADAAQLQHAKQLLQAMGDIAQKTADGAQAQGAAPAGQAAAAGSTATATPAAAAPAAGQGTVLRNGIPVAAGSAA
jgi:hypothetical protein